MKTRWHVVALAILVTACGRSCGGADPGSECTASSECAGGLVCTPSDATHSRCMSSCDDSTIVCADGSVCLDVPCVGRVCWFGGTTPRESACNFDLECEAGTLCSGGRCEQACQLQPPSYYGEPAQFDGSELCFGGEQCAALEEGGNAGHCIPIPDAGVDAGPIDAGPVDAAMGDAGTDAGTDAGVDAGFDAGLPDAATCAREAGVTSP